MATTIYYNIVQNTWSGKFVISDGIREVNVGIFIQPVQSNPHFEVNVLYINPHTFEQSNVWRGVSENNPNRTNVCRPGEGHEGRIANLDSEDINNRTLSDNAGNQYTQNPVAMSLVI